MQYAITNQPTQFPKRWCGGLVSSRFNLVVSVDLRHWFPAATEMIWIVIHANKHSSRLNFAQLTNHIFVISLLSTLLDPSIFIVHQP
jgi:hypothetical protein